MLSCRGLLWQLGCKPLPNLVALPAVEIGSSGLPGGLSPETALKLVW